MIGGSEIKYVDRDVRDHPELRDLVYDYLENYTGEFPFLVELKMRAEREGDFTTAMFRGALNCMRNDPRVDLPSAPSGQEADVIPMEGRKKKRKRFTPYDEHPLCPLFEAGIYHHHKRMDHSIWPYQYCGGLWRINRETVRTSVKINRPFVKGKSHTSFLIHKVMPEGPHNCAWNPPITKLSKWAGFHEFGFGRTDLHVKLACKHPSWLTNPILIKEWSVVDEYNQDPIEVNGNPVVWTECPRCFA